MVSLAKLLIIRQGIGKKYKNFCPSGCREIPWWSEESFEQSAREIKGKFVSINMYIALIALMEDLFFFLDGNEKFLISVKFSGHINCTVNKARDVTSQSNWIFSYRFQRFKKIDHKWKTSLWESLMKSSGIWDR